MPQQPVATTATTVSTTKPVVNSPPPISSSSTTSTNKVNVAPLEPTKAIPKNPIDNNNNRVFASPLARKLARDVNMNLTLLTNGGSGPNGRIIAKDVQDAIANPTLLTKSSAGSTVVADNNFPPANRDWVMNKLHAPHYYLNVNVDFGEALKMLNDFNKKKLSPSISVNDFVILACAQTMKQVPEANACWHEETIAYYNYCDVNLTVSDGEENTQDAIIGGVEELGLLDIAVKTNDLLVKMQTNQVIQQNESSLGTVSIINVGAYGLKSIVPIVRPTHSIAIGVGAVQDTLVVNANGEVKLSKVGNITLACDHRVVDGAVGAKYLQHMKSIIENPLRMLL